MDVGSCNALRMDAGGCPLETLITAACQAGSDVVIQLKQAKGDTYQGRIQSVTATGFTLFHSGPKGGILWAFRYTDVATCGLLVDMPPQDMEAMACIESDSISQA
jgi:hypothetical protein